MGFASLYPSYDECSLERRIKLDRLRADEFGLAGEFYDGAGRELAWESGGLS
jgi:hypothetical protein